MTTTSGTEKPTFVGFVDTLTGYEEQDIVKVFGKTLGGLLDDSLSTARRALIYVDARRNGLDAKAAKERAMSMTIKGVTDFFAKSDEDDEGDVIDGEPTSEAGKDDSPSA